MYGLLSVGIGLAGPGRFSVDAQVGLLPYAAMPLVLLAAAAGVLGAAPLAARAGSRRVHDGLRHVGHPPLPRHAGRPRRLGHDSSAQGIAIDPGFSAVLKGAFIACDPPEHRPQRQVLADRLTAPALRSLKDQIHTWAAEHVDKCLADTTFDAVTGLARPYPLHVIGSLPGFPRVPERLADRASAPSSPSARPTSAPGVIHLLVELEAFLSAEAGPDSVPADSFGAEIHHAAKRGAVTTEQAASILRAYATAGIDTTVNVLSSVLWLLARHPDPRLPGRPPRPGSAINADLLRAAGGGRTAGRAL